MNIWILIIALVVVIGIVLCLIRSQYERGKLVVSNYDIEVTKLGKEWDGFTMAVLADLHDHSFGENNRELIRAIDGIHPDCILIAGDMLIVKEWKKQDMSVPFSLLETLSKEYPIYYGNGNHEQRMREEKEKYPGWYEQYEKKLQELQIHHLQNEGIMLQKGTSKVAIYGVDIDKRFYKKGKKVHMEHNYIERQIGTCNKELFNILLAHTPLYVEEYEKWGADLVFSGHFHGGTIRLPKLGGVMSPQCQFFTKRDRGIVSYGKVKMVVSGGLGTHSINIRLNNLPEVVVVRLRCKDT